MPLSDLSVQPKFSSLGPGSSEDFGVSFLYSNLIHSFFTSSGLTPDLIKMVYSLKKYRSTAPLTTTIIQSVTHSKNSLVIIKFSMMPFQTICVFVYKNRIRKTFKYHMETV